MCTMVAEKIMVSDVPKPAPVMDIRRPDRSYRFFTLRTMPDETSTYGCLSKLPSTPVVAHVTGEISKISRDQNHGYGLDFGRHHHLGFWAMKLSKLSLPEP